MTPTADDEIWRKIGMIASAAAEWEYADERGRNLVRYLADIGIRLVPVEATQEMVRAAHGKSLCLAEEFAVMCAASPYAPSSNAEGRRVMSGAEKIITTVVYPPIPIRSMDWSAHFNGREESGPYGWGATKDEAIRDLMLVAEMDESTDDRQKDQPE